MAFRLPGINHGKQQILRRKEAGNLMSRNVPKGYFAVYVGEEQKKRFLVPISYLKEPAFQDLLRMAKEEYGFDHPMGGLTIPCREDIFTDLTARLNNGS